jgi:hypothetical protein
MRHPRRRAPRLRRCRWGGCEQRGVRAAGAEQRRVRVQEGAQPRMALLDSKPQPRRWRDARQWQRVLARGGPRRAPLAQQRHRLRQKRGISSRGAGGRRRRSARRRSGRRRRVCYQLEQRAAHAQARRMRRRKRAQRAVLRAQRRRQLAGARHGVQRQRARGFAAEVGTHAQQERLSLRRRCTAVFHGRVRGL